MRPLAALREPMAEIESSNFMGGSTSSMRRRIKLPVPAVVIAFLVLVLSIAESASVPVPKVTGPIPVTARPGDPSHNYPFGATQADLAKNGYREDEYFIEGDANEYVSVGTSAAIIAPGGPYAYKTRVTVRRPISASKFNGTLILEWNNVSADRDQE